MDKSQCNESLFDLVDSCENKMPLINEGSKLDSAVELAYRYLSFQIFNLIYK